MLKTGLSGEESVKGERLAARIMIDSLLRQLLIVGGVQKSDLMLTVVYLSILSANVQHMAPDSDLARRYSSIDEPAPDRERRPISAHSLALSLGIPYETARRYIGKLIDQGMAVRISGGVIVPAACEASDASKEHVRQLYTALRRQLAMLRRAGFDIEAMSQS